MKLLIFISSISFGLGVGSITFINNSDLKAQINIWPMDSSLAPFGGAVGARFKFSSSIVNYVRKLPDQGVRPLISAAVKKEFAGNPHHVYETYCHPAGKPLSFFAEHDASIKIIYDDIGHCRVEGVPTK